MTKILIHFKQERNSDEEEIEEIVNSSLEKLDYVKSFDIEEVFPELEAQQAEVVVEMHEYDSETLSSKLGGDLGYAHHVQTIY